MTRRSQRRASRGLTLVEMLIANALVLALIAGGMAAGVELQRRTRLEEQTVLTQASGHALRAALETQLLRAGTGMGSARIVFDGDGNTSGGALVVLSGPDFAAAHVGPFAQDSDFALPASGGPYAAYASDALQLWWAESDAMTPLADCDGAGAFNPWDTVSGNLCIVPDLPPAALAQTDRQALLVNPTLELACHVELGPAPAGLNRIQVVRVGRTEVATTGGPCATPTDPIWGRQGWLLAATGGAAYRVNWDSGGPVLEYAPLPAATLAWREVSRSVERLQVRQAVVDLENPLAAPRWFPDAAASPQRPGIEECTLAQAAAGGVCEVLGMSAPPTTPDALRVALRRRVRDVEVTLTVRSPQPDRAAIRAGPDELGRPHDGYRRRVTTFRASPRNLAVAGVSP